MTCGIYKIETRPGRFYIGSSRNCEKRWWTHKRRLKNGVGSNPKLQRSYIKNGGEACFSVMFVCREEDLFLFEQRALDVLKPPLNLNQLASGWSGPHAPASNKKRSLSLKGRPKGPLTPEHRAAISRALVGRPLKPEAIAKRKKTLRAKIDAGLISYKDRSAHLRTLIWVTDGKSNRRVTSVPKGWWRGRSHTGQLGRSAC